MRAFQSGQAWLENRTELTGLAASPHRRRLGIARTFQNIRLFKDLTALENVLIGMHTRRRDDTLAQLATLPFFRRDERAAINDAHGLMESVGLRRRRDRQAVRAGTLPYGDQRRLEIARALALSPRLLILDEPAAGMNPSEKQGMRELIERLNRDGLTILLIDHDMRLVMGVCQRVAVLNFGRKIADGTPEEVSTDADGDQGVPRDGRRARRSRARPARAASTRLQTRRRSRLARQRGRASRSKAILDVAGPDGQLRRDQRGARRVASRRRRRGGGSDRRQRRRQVDDPQHAVGPDPTATPGRRCSTAST